MEFAAKNGYKLDVEAPDPGKKEGWFTTRQGAYRPDRKQFLLDMWKKNFPHIPVKDFDSLAAIMTRSEVGRDFNVQTLKTYKEQVEVPFYLKKVMKPADFAKLKGNVEKINKVNELEAKDITAVAEQYAIDLKAIKEKYESQRLEITSDDWVYCITLPSDKLPLSIVLSITNFTPKNAKDPAERREFAREWLMSYKRSLGLAVANGQDPRKLVEEFASK